MGKNKIKIEKNRECQDENYHIIQKKKGINQKGNGTLFTL